MKTKTGKTVSSNEEQVKTCVELVHPNQSDSLTAAIEEDPKNLPSVGYSNAIISESAQQFNLGSLITNRPFIAVIFTKRWKIGRTLKIAFIGNIDDIVKEKIKKYASVWTKYINIKFDFVNDQDGDIRITTNAGGSWSYIGTDAKLIQKDKPTMNYGWFSKKTPDIEFQRVVLHEFGHALGAIHEHQHPKAGIPWNKPKVYQYYRSSQGWSKEDVDNNIFRKYEVSHLNYNTYDETSIMHYPISNNLTIGDWEVGWNTNLSANDIAFMSELYS